MRQHWPELQDHKQDTQPPHDLTTACFLPLLLSPFLNPQYSCHPEFLEPSDMPGGHISCLHSHHFPLSDCFLKLSLWLTLAWICYPSSFWLWENLTMYFLVLWTLIPEHLWIFVGAVLFINTIQSSNPWKWLEEKDIIFCISCSPGLKQGTVLNEWLNKQMNTCFYVPL